MLHTLDTIYAYVQNFMVIGSVVQAAWRENVTINQTNSLPHLYQYDLILIPMPM